MRKTKCINGHFFDGDSSELCPVCNSQELNTVEKKQGRVPQKGVLSWFTQGKDCGKEETNGNEKQGYAQGQRKDSIEREENPTVTLYSPHLCQMRDEIDKEETPKVGSVINDAETPAPHPVTEKRSLTSELKSISSTEDPVTVGMFMKGKQEPVVGWLVCIKGESLGESFEIYVGQNSIGRSNSNNIVLAKENTVSREKHAFITFDPINLDFYVQKGESSGLTYLDNKLIMGFEKIMAYNILKLGNSEFVFVPLCGESFKWDDYIE